MKENNENNMDSFIGRYLYYNAIYVNISEVSIDYNDINFYVQPDCVKGGWWINFRTMETLIDSGFLIRVDEYVPIKPKKYVPSLSFIKYVE